MLFWNDCFFRSDISTIVYGLNVKEKVKEKIMEVYQIIAQAESFVHGTTVEQVHFYEVGAMDAVADITAVCYLIDKLNVEKITASAINTGNGYCRTMHGILPVPAPATAKILEGMASYDDGVRGELCTPTGAALIKAFSSSYGPRPNMRIEKIGNGMGKKDFERANCIRLFLGESENALKDSVILFLVSLLIKGFLLHEKTEYSCFGFRWWHKPSGFNRQ